jgi:redox-sensitive bicupin YhaK (pirin superfamily)
MDKPSYMPLTAENTPVYQSGDGAVSIKIVTGELENVKGPIPALSPINAYTAEFKKSGKYFFRMPASHNLFIYLLDGRLKINNEAEVLGKYAVVFENDGDGFEVEALEDTRFFIGSGEPLREAVVSQGPFVMNNQTELLQAFRDYQMGKMGILIED